MEAEIARHAIPDPSDGEVTPQIAKDATGADRVTSYTCSKFPDSSA